MVWLGAVDGGVVDASLRVTVNAANIAATTTMAVTSGQRRSLMRSCIELPPGGVPMFSTVTAAASRGGKANLSPVDLVSPRERGRYMGYLGAVMAVGTVAGPL